MSMNFIFQGVQILFRFELISNSKLYSQEMRTFTFNVKVKIINHFLYSFVQFRCLSILQKSNQIYFCPFLIAFKRNMHYGEEKNTICYCLKSYWKHNGWVSLRFSRLSDKCRSINLVMFKNELFLLSYFCYSISLK